jgi:hypothetical protein
VAARTGGPTRSAASSGAGASDAVWVFDPRRRVVSIRESPSTAYLLMCGQVIDGNFEGLERREPHTEGRPGPDAHLDFLWR